jgi:hypothetical protein
MVVLKDSISLQTLIQLVLLGGSRSSGPGEVPFTKADSRV